MRSSAFIPHAGFMRKLRPLSSFILLLTAMCAANPLLAQEALQPTPSNSMPYTLHLYARLVELPTMIFLNRGRKPPVLEPQQIDIKLNAEPPFHPTSLRIEGDDPLSIAILFDVSGDQRDLLSAFQKQLSPWVTSSLRPQDRVSLYTVDCDLFHTSENAPPNPTILQRDLDLALTSPLTHATAQSAPCAKSVPIRGSILFITHKLAERPGRHILLIVTGGRDGKSDITWPQLISEAGRSSVTVFAITRPYSMGLQQLQDIHSLTQESGGLLLSTTPDTLPKTLERIISLLRSRYILQFPLPPSMGPVVYRVFVTVPKFDAVTLPSGIGVPLPNPSLDHPSTDLPSEVPEASPTVPPTADLNR
jgi:hypothetical protein